jgi:hypothetical protein
MLLRLVLTVARSKFGRPAQSASSTTSESSASPSPHASPITGALALSTSSQPGELSMSFLSNFNLANFASALVTVAQKAETAVADAKLVYTYAANVIHAAETAYAGQTNAGATKKAAVLAAAEAFATSLGANWSLLEAGLSAWIDVVIAGYNAAAVVIGKPQVNQSVVDATVATGEAAATVVVNTAASVANGTISSTNTSGL